MSITLQKITVMIERQKHENDFAIAVSRWLKEMDVPFKTQNNESFAVIKSEAVSLVLDFMRIPYYKPQAKGYTFSLDHFLFHPIGLKSRIQSLFGKTETIFARNCSASRITKKEAEPFFEANHISGYANAKLKYGLHYRGELVATITFAQGRNLKISDGIMRSYEWVGFCQKAGITVTGGLSKLLKTFERDKQPDHIATYIDCDWADGNAFKKLGFKITEELPALPFNIDWKTGLRSFPSRGSRKSKTFDPKFFPYRNSGYVKFEHFYNSK